MTGGTFYRTYTNTGGTPANEADQATVSGFRLDKYLVTVGRFRKFVGAWSQGAGTPQSQLGKHTHLHAGQGLARAESAGAFEPGWNSADNGSIVPNDTNLTGCAPYSTWSVLADPTGDKRPINCVNWYEAYAFCIWDGGFLPSEAEWEYAAAGGVNQQAYPWGPTAPGTNNAYAIYGCNYQPDAGSCWSAANIAPVGLAPLGHGNWGQLDLAGELYEWTLDGLNAFVSPCLDCASFANPAVRASHGGNYAYPVSYMSPTYRDNTSAITHYAHVGFRCARSP